MIRFVRPFVVIALAASFSETALACGEMMLDDFDDSPLVDESIPYVFYTAPKLEKKGAADVNYIGEALSKVSRDFGYCYEDLLRRDSNALTEANYRFDIAKDGSLRSAKMMKTKLSMKDKAFDACLDAAASGFEIPEEAIKSAVAFTTSFRFTPPTIAEAPMTKALASKKSLGAKKQSTVSKNLKSGKPKKQTAKN